MEYLQIVCLTAFPVRLFVLGLDVIYKRLRLKRSLYELGATFFLALCFIIGASSLDFLSIDDIFTGIIRSCIITILIFGTLLFIEFLFKDID